MGKKQELIINFEGEQWNFVFKMRRKNHLNKANYTFNYYINQEKTKILEESYTKKVVRTCPINIDEIITCYFHSDYFNTLNSWKLLDVINNSFKNSCPKCNDYKDNKCKGWELWGNGNSLVSEDEPDEPIIFKERNSFFDLYEINNAQ